MRQIFIRVAIQAEFHSTFGVALDTYGNLYIADGNNRRIRKVDFNPNCWPASVQEHKLISLNIYPNPVHDQLTIAGENIQQVSITNALGQIVHWQKISQEKTVINMSVLNAGVYFVMITDKQGVKVTKKVVKE